MKKLHGKRKPKKIIVAALAQMQVDNRNRHADIIARLEQISDAIKRMEGKRQ